MGKQYANPPLEEVLVEFRFGRSSPWDPVLPEMMYQKMGPAEFPTRKIVVAPLSSHFDLGPAQLKHTSEFGERVSFHAKDSRLIVHLASDLLAVQKLRPYESWESYVPIVHQAYDVYVGVGHPSALLGLRLLYIDKLQLPCGLPGLPAYLNLAPFAGAGLADREKFDTFITGIQAPHEDGRDSLRIELVTAAPAGPSSLHLILRTCYSLERPNDLALDAKVVQHWLDVAHTHVNSAFEACITDKLRSLFNIEEPNV